MWLSVNVRPLTVADLTEFEILASLYIRQRYCCLHDRPPDKLAQAGRAHLETGRRTTETQHQTDDTCRGQAGQAHLETGRGMTKTGHEADDHADKSNVDRQT